MMSPFLHIRLKDILIKILIMVFEWLVEEFGGVEPPEG
jgi:hypothetical protein